MTRTARLTALALLLAAHAAAVAAEHDPWLGEQHHLRHRMEERADAAARGDIGPGERVELLRYRATHLHRGRMNALESARYSLAELQLERAEPKRALAELTTVLATTQSADVRHLTHLNLGQIHRLWLHDDAKAIEHFRQVGGPLRHRARHYTLALLEDAGKPAAAAKLLEQLIADAKEKGEKLALLHRLAVLYKRAYRADEALAVYQRITKEFAPADLQQMRLDIERTVEAAFVRMMALHDQGRGHDAEQLGRRLERRADDLRLAGRWDEQEAFRKAMHKGFRQMDEFRERRERVRDERERDERERNERDRDERDRDERERDERDRDDDAPREPDAPRRKGEF